MNKPFISIVIPTRDRADFIPVVLKFIKEQSFANFEVIISDNGTTAISLDTIQTFLDDERFTYKRPPKSMSMTNHWNFAIEGASGEYISIFNEKFFLGKDALQIIYDTYQLHNPDLISWNYEWLAEPILEEGEITGFYHPKYAPSQTKVFSSSEYLLNYFQIKYPLLRNNRRDLLESRFGRIYGGCVKKSVIENIQAKYGKVFFPISPDYTSQYLFLNETKSGIHIGQTLMLHIVFKAISNGMNVEKSLQQFTNFLTASEIDVESYKVEGPIPNFYAGLTYSVMRDLFLLKNIVSDGIIKDSELNMPALCFYAKLDLDVMEDLDIDIRNEHEKMLENTLSKFTKEQREYYETLPQLLLDKKENRGPNFLYASNFEHLDMKKSHKVEFDISAYELAKSHWCDKVMRPLHKSIFSNRVTLSEAVDYMRDYNNHSCQMLGIQ